MLSDQVITEITTKDKTEIDKELPLLLKVYVVMKLELFISKF